MAAELENLSIEELEAALAVAKDRKAEQDRIAREERRARERAEFIDRVEKVRENTVDKFVGDHDAWLAINMGFNGAVDLTIFEGTTDQASIFFNAEHVAKLKEIVAAL